MSRKLYFDIDGTILFLSTPCAKPALAGGMFGRAVRAAGFDELVCIGNFSGVALAAKARIADYDSLGATYDVCYGVFDDEPWFRAHTRLIRDPARRAAEIDLSDDWWYIDDLAEMYFAHAGRADVYREHLGGRILVPTPEGDGEDVLAWIRAIARKR